MNIQDKFYEAIKNNDIDNVKLLLKDKRVDLSDDYNASIQIASENGHFDIVKLLLEDVRVDPADHQNYAIQLAFDNKHFNIIKLLWKDQRVKNTLKNDIPYLYNQIIVKKNVEEF